MGFFHATLMRLIADSPAVPPSSHELFRGFSFVCPKLLEDQMEKKEEDTERHNTRQADTLSINSANTEALKVQFFVCLVLPLYF